MNVIMIGSGYVGLVSGACFSEFGNSVTCIDTDRTKSDALNKGIIPIYEPGLDALVEKNRQQGYLTFTSEYSAIIGDADLIFIAVGTPTRHGDGHADLTYVYQAAKDIAPYLSGYYLSVRQGTSKE